MSFKRIMIMPVSKKVMSESVACEEEEPCCAMEELAKVNKKLNELEENMRFLINVIKEELSEQAVQEPEEEEEEEEEDNDPVVFLLEFKTGKDYEKAEPCLRSLSDLFENQNIDYNITAL